MRTSGIIAGSIGLSLVLALLVVVGVVAAAALYQLRPSGVLPPSALRATVLDHADALAFCAPGLAEPVTLTATVAVHGGAVRQLHVKPMNFPAEGAECVARTLTALPWPDGSGAATLSIRVDPWRP